MSAPESALAMPLATAEQRAAAAYAAKHNSHATGLSRSKVAVAWLAGWRCRPLAYAGRNAGKTPGVQARALHEAYVAGANAYSAFTPTPGAP